MPDETRVVPDAAAAVVPVEPTTPVEPVAPPAPPTPAPKPAPAPAPVPAPKPEPPAPPVAPVDVPAEPAEPLPPAEPADPVPAKPCFEFGTPSGERQLIEADSIEDAVRFLNGNGTGPVYTADQMKMKQVERLGRPVVATV